LQLIFSCNYNAQRFSVKRLKNHRHKRIQNTRQKGRYENQVRIFRYSKSYKFEILLLITFVKFFLDFFCILYFYPSENGPPTARLAGNNIFLEKKKELL